MEPDMYTTEVQVSNVDVMAEVRANDLILSARHRELQAPLRIAGKVAMGLAKAMGKIAKGLGLESHPDIRIELVRDAQGQRARLKCLMDLPQTGQVPMSPHPHQFDLALNREVAHAVDLLDRSASMGQRQTMHAITSDPARQREPDVVYSSRRVAVALAVAVMDSGLLGELWVTCGQTSHRFAVPVASRHVVVDPLTEVTVTGHWVQLTRPQHSPVAMLRDGHGRRRIYAVVYDPMWYDELYRAMDRGWTQAYRVDLRLITTITSAPRGPDERWELVHMGVFTVPQQQSFRVEK